MSQTICEVTFRNVLGRFVLHEQKGQGGWVGHQGGENSIWPYLGLA